jgi:GNAT superfamily N-acetyltransferase
VNNPRAEAEDVLLLLAYEGSEMVGYLGVFPDWMWYEGKFEKFGWLSCLWIDGKHRGKKIAFQLVSKALEMWEQRIFVTEFTGPAKRLYDKTEAFQDLHTLKGVRLYLRSDLQYLLPPKRPLFAQLKPLLKVVDGLVNALGDLRFPFLSSELSGLQLSYLTGLDADIQAFVAARQEQQLFRRSITELNWAIQHPWLLQAPGPDADSARYYFSSVATSFSCLPIKVVNEQHELVAVLIFTMRDGRLKLPYCYYDLPVERVVAIIRHYLIAWKAKTFTTFHPEIVAYLKTHGTFALGKKEIQRAYIFSTVFDKARLPQTAGIQDGDADCFFT